jgi:hypothetical protein
VEIKLQKEFAMSDDKIKHLEFIQGIINRMGSNSFQMKGWMITIVSALLAIFADKQNKLYVLFALFPTIIFWGLDAYYLQQERIFRGLYNDVAGVSDKPKEIKLFAMPLNLYTGGKYSYLDVATSKTLRWLYIPVVVILLVVYFFL